MRKDDVATDVIKQAMASFAEAHQQSMEAMAERNLEALVPAVERITPTLAFCDGHTSPEVPSHGFSPYSLCTYLFGCRKRASLLRKGAHTDLSVATIVTSGNSGCYSPWLLVILNLPWINHPGGR